MGQPWAVPLISYIYSPSFPDDVHENISRNSNIRPVESGRGSSVAIPTPMEVLSARMA